MSRRRLAPRARRGVSLALLPLLLLAAVRACPPAGAEEKIHDARARRLARDVRPAIVRVQWRPRTGAGRIVDRHAVVIDPEGWLLLAGPPPSPAGTLAATFDDGRAARAEVWASDPETALTVLRVPLFQLPPLSLRAPVEPEEDTTGPGPAPEPRGTLPPRLPPGFPFLLVTAECACARGALRASHRQRSIEDPLDGSRRVVTCLDEASLNVIATDLGAPWIDEDGRIIGLLVGAEVGVPATGDDQDGDVEMRPEVTAAYAVPAEVIRIVWPLLKDRREVPRGRLGVRVRALSEPSRQHLCPGCAGYEVTDLAPGGPAQLAGLELLDVIRSVNARSMAPDADLADVLLPHRPGSRVTIGVLRRGEPMDIEVVLGRAE